MRSPITFLLICYFYSCQSQHLTQEYNLSFENRSKGAVEGWRANSRSDSSTYAATLDSGIVKEGRYAASIEYKGGKPHFTTWVSSIPENYAGDSITLTGFIKTQDVTDGYAGMWMRIDPGIAFDNMSNRGPKGTTDWTAYKITLPLNPDKSERIVFGGMLVGKGKMWLDDLQIAIDGKDIAQLSPLVKTPADKDHEFDRQSLIAVGALDSNKINALYQLGLIWGFLKYRHPNVVKGDYNWDYQLFRVLPKIINAPENRRAHLLSQWIDTLGLLPETAVKNADVDVVLKPDLEWVHELSDGLRQRLLKVDNVKTSNQQQYYVTQTPARNALFRNEKSYSYMAFPDEGFRLLALYRYWNMVEYFFPYRKDIGADWKTTLKAFIPKFLKAQNELEYKLALLELAGQIHDTHAFFDYDRTLSQFFGNRYLPIKLKFIEDRAVIVDVLNDRLAKKDDWQKGDILVKINGKPVEALIKAMAPHTPASNRWTQLRDIAGKLTRTNDTAATVEILRAGKTILKNQPTYPGDQLRFGQAPVLANLTYKWAAPSIGYIDNGRLKNANLPAVFEQFKNAKGIIIDLRNYPSDYLVYSLPPYFLSKPTAFVKFLVPDLRNPGSFTYTPEFKTGAANEKAYKGRVILLIDETTQSSAEYHAMAYRTCTDCLVMGSPSTGADGNVSEIILPGNVKTRFSGIGVFYPDGSPTQRVGIQPDIVVRPTIIGIREGRDEVLEEAIKRLSQ